MVSGYCALLLSLSAEVDKKRSQPTRPKTKLVRESSAQTTPVQSPFKSSKKQHGHANGDYRTIVHVYDSPQRTPSILSVYQHSGESISSRPEVPGQDKDPKYPVRASRKPNGLRTISDDEDSENESSQSNQKTVSDHSFESYQAKALSAIKALDEVVANEPLGSPGEPISPAVPPPPPPPLPSAPPPPPPLPGAAKDKMNVKRINWEKIETPDAQSIWAKVRFIKVVLLHCCPVCPSCLANLNSIGWSTWFDLGTKKEIQPNCVPLKNILFNIDFLRHQWLLECPYLKPCATQLNSFFP